ncbi:MAG: heavy metal translocating P-type ATPase [Candidatus Promineifilaceae bacterium]
MKDNSNILEFKVQGMDCANCAKTIESAVAGMNGVEQAELSFATETLRVRGSRPVSDITAVVNDLGYTLQNEPGKEMAAMGPSGFAQFLWGRPETRTLLLAALLILPGLLFNELLRRDYWWVDALAIISLILAGWPVARSAWKSLRYGRTISINLLMTIAAIGAVIIGANVEAAMVMVLFALGEALEGYTAGRARHAIRELMQVAPATATLIRREAAGEAAPQQLQEVAVEKLIVGDHILVRPGERIPMDGQVVSGASTVDQAAITGESRPITKASGDTLFAGSMNGEGALEIEVTHLAQDNTISRMIALVEEAQDRRAPAQRFVDQFASYYTPAIVVLAIAVAAIPPLFFGQPFWNTAAGELGWFYRGLALLVVACPCALVISTPVSIISAISNAARHGVLFKGGAYLERLSRVRAMAFDKTGTLTEGKPSVVSLRTAACETDKENQLADCSDCDEMLALAGAVESRSEHPLARAVSEASAARGLLERYPSADNVSALTGRGVKGWVRGHQVMIGSHQYFDGHIAHSAQQCALAAGDEQQGYTPLLVGRDDAYLGTITVADKVRASSQDVIAELKVLGMKSLVMLTGDSRVTAERTAAEIGMTDVRAELLPEDKVAAVQALQEEYGPVAMVGDGINDAPALATADVGIAVGGAGKPSQAMETADITLMEDEIVRLPFAVGLSKATMRTIYANVALSIGIKLVFLLLVLAGVGTMWMAVLADVGTSLLVTLNGMRLLTKQPA